MLDIHNTFKRTTPDASPLETGETSTTGSPVATSQPLLRRLWRIVKRYPIPFGSGALLGGSLVLWLAGHGDLANWMVLAVVLLGGLPLVWETFQQVLHKEFSVDVIAVLALTGSLLLGEYLAGAFVVLMLSGGEALEAYALRRAPTTMPLDCASARYSNCLASILPASR
jgi:cation transport ATPase